LTNGVAAFKESYQTHFDKSFPVPAAFNDSYRDFSRDITANLLGGVGYFYGDSIIDHAFVEEWDREEDGEDDEASTHQSNPRLVPPMELLTATPSRSFFPRGFYW
jgi:mannosyl-oligosaccharide glucosidase